MLFHPKNRHHVEGHERLHAFYEIVITTVDFLAAMLFVIGSALFFRPATTYLATWLFVVGSVFFALSPSLRLTRELHYWRIGRLRSLARRVEGL